MKNVSVAGSSVLEIDEGGNMTFQTWDKDFALDFEEVVPAYYTNLLLVEDDNATANYIKSLAKRSMRTPLRIRSFSSAEKAGEYINSLKSHHLPGPDYAIIDYLLTGPADGLWLCKLIESKFPETLSLLISSSDKQSLLGKMEEYNINPQFVKKPIGPMSLFGFLK